MGVGANVVSMDDSGQLSAQWAAVYEQSSQRLTRLAVLLVGHAEAHDLVTDAVWRAVSSPHWPRVTSPSAYLTRSLVNLTHDRRRQADRRRRREISTAARAGSVGEVGVDVERSVVVRRALAALSPTQLAVVFLHYWDDLTLERAAAELGIGVGTARSHLDRAKRPLRPLLPDFETEYKR